MRGKKRILIASDHAGLGLKTKIQEKLTDWVWIDLGPLNNEERVDYPAYAKLLASKIIDGDSDQGILICGSGIGMSIAANKISGIRAAVVENPIAARLSREHNDANVLCLGSRFLAPEYGAEIAQVWLNTPFSEDARHTRRIDLIRALENPSKESKNVRRR